MIQWFLGTRICENKNENSPHSLIYLNVWTTVSGTVWEGLADMALLEECGLAEEDGSQGVGSEVSKGQAILS